MNQTEKLAEEIRAKLMEHGISDYVLAVRDPDSDFDLMWFNGSQYWRIGVAEILKARVMKSASEGWEDIREEV